MRELQVIGMDAGGKNVLLQVKGSEDRFSVPADDRLRAAARGDLSRLGQIEVETSSQLRPREIQARVRAGASVAEVAELAGIPESRVERFAHPVLLERGNAADMGRKGHPVRSDGPAVQTLEEIVTIVFRARGLDPEAGEWDAWRTADGEWVVQLSWWAGRSRNSAHWRLYKEGLTGTLNALDDAATELLDPDVNRPLRPIASVPAPTSAPHVGIHGPDVAGVEPDSDAAPEVETAAPRVGTEPGAQAGDAGAAPADGVAAGDGARQDDASGRDRTGTDRPSAEDAEAPADDASPAEPRPGRDEESEDALIPHPSPHTRGKARKHKPTMPSWEDVLLGVRSNANG
ncbi:septation protein SepH [Tomitella fengzijianii]|uniref:septation protein SepH n=1 Tax=Tomitella fengzijianii TaxID=2597660 RepID=UPI0018EECF53|nr:septation protein SepH [Tomitella fengzijianii]